MKKIRQAGTGLIYVDRQTDRQTDIRKLIQAFREYANSLKIRYTQIVLARAKRSPSSDSTVVTNCTCPQL